MFTHQMPVVPSTQETQAQYLSEGNWIQSFESNKQYCITEILRGEDYMVLWLKDLDGTVTRHTVHPESNMKRLAR